MSRGWGVIVLLGLAQTLMEGQCVRVCACVCVCVQARRGHDLPVGDCRRHGCQHSAASAHESGPAVDGFHAEAHRGRVREEGEQEGQEEPHA